MTAMTVTVRIPTTLRPLTGGKSEIAAEPSTAISDLPPGRGRRVEGMRAVTVMAVRPGPRCGAPAAGPEGGPGRPHNVTAGVGRSRCAARPPCA